MDCKEGVPNDDPLNSPVLTNDSLGNFSLSPFSDFDSPNMCFGVRADQLFPEFSLPLDLDAFQPNCEVEEEMGGKQVVLTTAAASNESGNAKLNWDPRAMLTNLSALEEEIHKVQDVVRTFIGKEGQVFVRPDELAAQQQLVTADLTSIIVHMISTAGDLLPSVKSTFLSGNPPSLGQLQNFVTNSSRTDVGDGDGAGGSVETSPAADNEDHSKVPKSNIAEASEHAIFDEHDSKDCEEGDCENLPPGSYEVLQLEKEEILAPHTHFCQICGKGFKRDANLRMHMRGHGDEYKTPAALAKPGKESNSQHVLIKRYSCPVLGCKRNREHRKFQPLKTILCVKNHYKRSHCDKSYTCSRCHSKKFSVIADLKTHEKHCGRDKWLCSCGTTFSRKDKLFGHVALFQGHTPALPQDENKALLSQLKVQTCAAGFDCSSSKSLDVDLLDIKGLDEDPIFLSSMNIDSCNFGAFHEFPQPTFEASDSSFPFMPALLNNCSRKNGENPSSSDLQEG